MEQAPIQKNLNENKVDVEANISEKINEIINQAQENYLYQSKQEILLTEEDKENNRNIMDQLQDLVIDNIKDTVLSNLDDGSEIFYQIKDRMNGFSSKKEDDTLFVDNELGTIQIFTGEDNNYLNILLRTNDSPKKEYRLSFKDGDINTNMISFDSPLEGEDIPFGSRKKSIMLGLEKSSVSLQTNPEVRTSHADEILKGESTPMTPERLKIWLEKSELTNFLSLIEGNIS